MSKKLYKWDEDLIRGEFRARDAEHLCDMARVRKFQKHTNDLEECVTWVINSKRNDKEQRARELSHGTGAY